MPAQLERPERLEWRLEWSGPEVVAVMRGGRGGRVVTIEQAQAATAVLQGRVEAEQARALAQLRVEQARAVAAREERAAEQAARSVAAVERAAARDAEAEARRVRRAVARERRRAAWTERRALLAVVPIMGTSAAVALPAQLEAFEGLTGHWWSAAVIAAMVEGGTWAGAAMESIAVRRQQPTGAYVALTWGCAAIACAMNVAHGLDGGLDGRHVQLAAAYGLASLLGPISWAVYSRLQRHIVAGRTGEQALLAAVRRGRFPIESWRALSLRAAQGAEVSVEDAWTQVWASRQARRAARRQGLVQVLGRVLRRSAPVGATATTATVTAAAMAAAMAAPAIATARVLVDELAGDLDERDAVSVSVPAPSPATPAPRPRPSVPRPSVPRPAGPRPGSRSLEDLRVQLVEAVRAGRLPATPSADAIRHELACSPSRARTLRDERRALTEQVAGQLDSHDLLEVTDVVELDDVVQLDPDVDELAADVVEPAAGPVEPVEPVEPVADELDVVVPVRAGVAA